MSCRGEAIDFVANRCTERFDRQLLEVRAGPVAVSDFGSWSGLQNAKEVHARWGCLNIRWVSAHSTKKVKIDAHSIRPQLIVILENTGCCLRVTSTPESLSKVGASRHLSVVAPKEEVWLCSEDVLDFRCVVVEIDPARLANTLGISCVAEDLFRTKLMFVSQELLTIGELIAFECLRERETDPRYAGALTSTLILALARITQLPAQRLCKGGLSPCQLRRATAYLEQHLREGTNLKALSELVGLSQHHFARAFKVSTGMAPLEWLRAARIRRVQTQLVDENMSLAKTAAASGFADQAHMTRVFRNMIGETPGAWRRRHFANE